MTKTLTLLLASTALTAAIGIPASQAMQVPADAVSGAAPAYVATDMDALPVVLASNDDDDDDEYRRSMRHRYDDDDDDDDECDDDDDCGMGAGNPAPAGAVAPPDNGLFGNGAPPQVQSN